MEALAAVLRSLVSCGAVTPDATVSAARELQVEAAVCRMLPELSAGTGQGTAGGGTARPQGDKVPTGTGANGSVAGNRWERGDTVTAASRAGAREGVARTGGQHQMPGVRAGAGDERVSESSEAATPTGAGSSDMLHYQQVRAAKSTEMTRLRSMVATLQDELRDQEGRTELIMSQVRCFPGGAWRWQGFTAAHPSVRRTRRSRSRSGSWSDRWQDSGSLAKTTATESMWST